MNSTILKCTEYDLRSSVAYSGNGGGPIGLAAVAHLVARGESFILFEAASDIAGNTRGMEPCTLVFTLAIQYR